MLLEILWSLAVGTSTPQSYIRSIKTENALQYAARGCEAVIKGGAVDDALDGLIERAPSDQSALAVSDQARGFFADASTLRAFGAEDADIVVLVSEAERRCQISDLSGDDRSDERVRSRFSDPWGWAWIGNVGSSSDGLITYILTTEGLSGRIVTASVARREPGRSLSAGAETPIRWIDPPRPNYPRVALERDVRGDVVLSCQLSPDGDLMDCAVLSEPPVEYGFGQAALIAAGQARARVDEGALGDDAEPIVFSLRFRLPD